ncbi:SRPBCC family protein [Novosphingobium colocasiae]|uniref:SRPBCC family protein n=1 Tax=Novosphingobium colocasiae TaxID=1256513 RepID=UPI0035ADD78C
MSAPASRAPDITVLEPVDWPIADVWALIGTFGALARWHPRVTACELIGDGIGSERRVTLGDWHAVERLEALDPDAHMLEYLMTDCARTILIGVRGRMRLDSTGPDRCTFTWTAWLPNPAPEGLEEFLRAYYPQRIAHLRAALDASAASLNA